MRFLRHSNQQVTVTFSAIIIKHITHVLKIEDKSPDTSPATSNKKNRCLTIIFVCIKKYELLIYKLYQLFIVYYK